MATIEGSVIPKGLDGRILDNLSPAQAVVDLCKNCARTSEARESPPDDGNQLGRGIAVELNSLTHLLVGLP